VVTGQVGVSSGEKSFHVPFAPWMSTTGGPLPARHVVQPAALVHVNSPTAGNRRRTHAA
jgi:hypothetical protein